MTKKIALLFLITFSTAIYAQKQGTIKAITKDSVSKTSMEYVTASLYTSDSNNLVTGGVTDFGSLKNLSINRNGELFSMDAMNYLEPGDQINIPGNIWP